MGKLGKTPPADPEIPPINLPPDQPLKKRGRPRKNTSLSAVAVSPASSTKENSLPVDTTVVKDNVEDSPSKNLRTLAVRKNGETHTPQKPEEKEKILTELRQTTDRSARKRLLAVPSPSPSKIPKTLAKGRLEDLSNRNKRKQTLPVYKIPSATLLDERAGDIDWINKKKTVKDHWLWESQRGRQEGTTLFRNRSVSRTSSAFEEEKGKMLSENVKHIKENEIRSGDSCEDVICVDLKCLIDANCLGHIKGCPHACVEVFLSIEKLNGSCKLISVGYYTVPLNNKEQNPTCIEIHYTKEEALAKNMYLIVRTKIDRLHLETRVRGSLGRGRRSVSQLPTESELLIGVLHLAHRNKRNELVIDYSPTNLKSLSLLDETVSPVKNANYWMSDGEQLKQIITVTKKYLRDSSDVPHLLARISSEYGEDNDQEDDDLKEPIKKEYMILDCGVRYVTKCPSVPTTSKDGFGVLAEIDSCTSPFDQHQRRLFSSVHALTNYLTHNTMLSFTHIGFTDDAAIIEVGLGGERRKTPFRNRKRSISPPPLETKLEEEEESLEDYFGRIMGGPLDLPSGPIKLTGYRLPFNPVPLIPCTGTDAQRQRHRATITCDWKHQWEMKNISEFTDVADLEKNWFMLWNSFMETERILECEPQKFFNSLRRFRETFVDKVLIERELYGLVRMWYAHIRTLCAYGVITSDQELALSTNDYSNLSEDDASEEQSCQESDVSGVTSSSGASTCESSPVKERMKNPAPISTSMTPTRRRPLTETPKKTEEKGSKSDSPTSTNGTSKGTPAKKMKKDCSHIPSPARITRQSASAQNTPTKLLEAITLSPRTKGRTKKN